MKRTFSAIALCLMSSFALAADDWRYSSFDGGEIVYKSGFEQFLLVGQKGFGFSSVHSIVDSFGDGVTVRIDNGPPEKFKITKLSNSTFLISNNDDLLQRVANAKKIELDYTMCFISTFCAFSERGGARNAVWNFSNSLADEYKDYQSKIR